jgi:uncharacterized protein (TIGR02001 family)
MEIGNMLNKKLLTAAVAAALMSGAGMSVAQEDDDRDVASGDGFEISGNVALTSDYRFRGISQSDESAAIQGGFDVEFSPGFYIGTWGSSVDFDNNEDYDGSLELDYYAGWSSAIGDTDFGIDVGYVYFDYPGDNGAEGDYQEFYVSGSWKDFSLSVNYSDDYYAETDEFWYYAADYSFSLVENLSLGLHVGYNDLEQGGGFLSSDEDSYTDYSVSLTWSVAGVDLAVAYVGTDLDDDDVFGTDWADDTAVFTISKSM